MKFDFSAYIVSVIMLLFNTVYSQDSFEEFLKQQQQAQEQAEDPIIQMRQQELQIRQQEAQSKIETAQAKIELEQAKLQMAQMKVQIDALTAMDKSFMEKEKLQTSERIEGARIAGSFTEKLVDAKIEDANIENQEAMESARVARDVAKEILKADEKRAIKGEEK